MVVATSFTALALQTRCEAVNGLTVADARARIIAAIDRIDRQIAAAKALLGPDLRLVVLPEYVLTGFPLTESIAHWGALAAIALDGAEADRLRACAERHDLFLAVNAYETDPAFAPLYFQTGLCFAPDGGVALRAHRLISMYAASPIDVWDAYLDRYGLDRLIPVARTDIGVLGSIASEEILYPEIARTAALRGAEILLHNTGEIGSPIGTAKEICRLARAVENAAYLVSANAAALIQGDLPPQTTDGMSKIVDYRGHILAAAASGETIGAHAEIDLAALRRHRTRPGMSAYLARIPADAIASIGAQLPGPALNGLLARDRSCVVPDRGWFRTRQQAVIERLISEGRLQRPGEQGGDT